MRFIDAVYILAIGLMARKIVILEHNFNALKDWLKVAGVIDLDGITKFVRDCQDEDETQTDCPWK